MEAFEEVSEAFKEFEEGIIARADSITCLRSLGIKWPRSVSSKEETHSEENIDADED